MDTMEDRGDTVTCVDYKRLPKTWRTMGPNDLPEWMNLRLGSKLPLIPGPSDAVVLYTTKLCEPLHQRPPQHGFDLADPNGQNLSIRYTSLHDPHLRAYYKQTQIHQRLVSNRFITPDDKVVCTLKDFNEYHRYLTKIRLDAINQDRQRKLLTSREEREEQLRRKVEVRQVEDNNIIRLRQQKAKDIRKKLDQKNDEDKLRYLRMRSHDEKRRWNIRQEYLDETVDRQHELSKMRDQKQMTKYRKEKDEARKNAVMCKIREESEHRRLRMLDERKRRDQRAREDRKKIAFYMREMLQQQRMEEDRERKKQEEDERMRNIEIREQMVREQRSKQRGLFERMKKRQSEQKENKLQKSFVNRWVDRLSTRTDKWKVHLVDDRSVSMLVSRGPSHQGISSVSIHEDRSKVRSTSRLSSGFGNVVNLAVDNALESPSTTYTCPHPVTSDASQHRTKRVVFTTEGETSDVRHTDTDTDVLNDFKGATWLSVDGSTSINDIDLRTAAHEFPSTVSDCASQLAGHAINLAMQELVPEPADSEHIEMGLLLACRSTESALLKLSGSKRPGEERVGTTFPVSVADAAYDLACDALEVSVQELEARHNKFLNQGMSDQSLSLARPPVTQTAVSEVAVSLANDAISDAIDEVSTEQPIRSPEPISDFCYELACGAMQDAAGTLRAHQYHTKLIGQQPDQPQETQPVPLTYQGTLSDVAYQLTYDVIEQAVNEVNGLDSVFTRRAHTVIGSIDEAAYILASDAIETASRELRQEQQQQGVNKTTTSHGRVCIKGDDCAVCRMLSPGGSKQTRYSSVRSGYDTTLVQDEFDISTLDGAEEELIVDVVDNEIVHRGEAAGLQVRVDTSSSSSSTNKTDNHHDKIPACNTLSFIDLEDDEEPIIPLTRLDSLSAVRSVSIDHSLGGASSSGSSSNSGTRAGMKFTVCIGEKRCEGLDSGLVSSSLAKISVKSERSMGPRRSMAMRNSFRSLILPDVTKIKSMRNVETTEELQSILIQRAPSDDDDLLADDESETIVNFESEDGTCPRVPRPKQVPIKRSMHTIYTVQEEGDEGEGVTDKQDYSEVPNFNHRKERDVLVLDPVEVTEEGLGGEERSEEESGIRPDEETPLGNSDYSDVLGDESKDEIRSRRHIQKKVTRERSWCRQAVARKPSIKKLASCPTLGIEDRKVTFSGELLERYLTESEDSGDEQLLLVQEPEDLITGVATIDPTLTEDSPDPELTPLVDSPSPETYPPTVDERPPTPIPPPCRDDPTVTFNQSQSVPVIDRLSNGATKARRRTKSMAVVMDTAYQPTFHAPDDSGAGTETGTDIITDEMTEEPTTSSEIMTQDTDGVVAVNVTASQTSQPQPPPYTSNTSDAVLSVKHTPSLLSVTLKSSSTRKLSHHQQKVGSATGTGGRPLVRGGVSEPSVPSTSSDRLQQTFRVYSMGNVARKPATVPQKTSSKGSLNATTSSKGLLKSKTSLSSAQSHRLKSTSVQPITGDADDKVTQNQPTP